MSSIVGHKRMRYAARSLFGLALLVPVMLAMQSTSPPTSPADDVWRYIAMAAMGGLITAFVLGRNAVTRQDLIDFEKKVEALIEKESPWEAVVQRRLNDGEKKIDENTHRIHQIAEDGQVALGLKEFVLQQIQMGRDTERRLAALESQRGAA